MKSFVHSPYRCYYQLCNSFVLHRRKHVPLTLALRGTVTIITLRLVLLIFVNHRGAYISNYVRAVIHGVKGIFGMKPIA